MVWPPRGSRRGRAAIEAWLDAARATGRLVPKPSNRAVLSDVSPHTAPSDPRPHRCSKEDDMGTQPVHRPWVQHTIGCISDALRGGRRAQSFAELLRAQQGQELDDVLNAWWGRQRSTPIRTATASMQPQWTAPSPPRPGDDDLRDLPRHDPASCRDQSVTHGADSNAHRPAPTPRSAVCPRPWAYLASISTTVHTDQTA